MMGPLAFTAVVQIGTSTHACLLGFRVPFGSNVKVSISPRVQMGPCAYLQSCRSSWLITPALGSFQSPCFGHRRC